MSTTYSFTKMQGCGNDYLYFDCLEQEIADHIDLMQTKGARKSAAEGDEKGQEA